jgi:hypothetical protein
MGGRAGQRVVNAGRADTRPPARPRGPGTGTVRRAADGTRAAAADGTRAAGSGHQDQAVTQAAGGEGLLGGSDLLERDLRHAGQP